MLRSFDYVRIRRESVLGVPVATQTIAHSHGHMLVYPGHGLDLPMAGLAENPRGYMRPMIEIDMIRERMNPKPAQELSRIEYSGKFLDLRAIGFRHLVAVHAFFRRRNSGLPRFEYPGMTIRAGNAQGARVKLM